MVLLVELLLAVGILVGVYRLATRPGEGMAVAEPDRRPSAREDGPLTADELVALHIPMGFGYRKIDVDLLLDRIARQLPRATYESASATGDEDPGFRVPDEADRVSLTKEDDRG